MTCWRKCVGGVSVEYGVYCTNAVVRTTNVEGAVLYNLCWCAYGVLFFSSTIIQTNSIISTALQFITSPLAIPGTSVPTGWECIFTNSTWYGTKPCCIQPLLYLCYTVVIETTDEQPQKTLVGFTNSIPASWYNILLGWPHNVHDTKTRYHCSVIPPSPTPPYTNHINPTRKMRHQISHHPLITPSCSSKCYLLDF